ncbi:MAG TPA: hypothetical protein VFM74_04410 [Candidatus Limnocylindria bacterium]|nr:hypothetical protein [Candidatus Limnocylindria bacterium]
MGGQSRATQVAALESDVRSLTRDEVERFGVAVRRAAQVEGQWPADRRFFFDGTADVNLSKEDALALRDLWTRMNAGLVYAVTGSEIFAWIDRPRLLARLDRIGPRWRQVEGGAATILERELGADVWLAATGIWNALCAQLLEDRLAAPLRQDLMKSWRDVRG